MVIFKRLILFLFSFLIAIMISCKKNDESTKVGNGDVYLKVKLDVGDFTSNFSPNKIAANYSYTPVQSAVLDINPDYMMLVDLEPMSYDIDNKIVSSKLLSRNVDNISNQVLEKDKVYRLMVFDSNGSFLTTRDYVRESESISEPLRLSQSTSYTFISYSLNSNRTDSLESILNVLPVNTTRTLSNTYITLEGNQDLLFYKKVYTTSNSATDYLNIVLKHQFNYIRTTINVAETGYGIDGDVAAYFFTSNNKVNIGFNSSTANVDEYTTTRSTLNNNTPLVFGTKSTAPNSSVANTLVSSYPIVYNVGNSEKLLKITSLTVNGILSGQDFVPFPKGVSLIPGGQYNLSVKIVPKDSIYDVDNHPVVRINGQVWMRHNLGADESTDPDIAAIGNLGGYYQWGQNYAVAPGTSNGGSSGVTNWVYNTTVNQALYDRWDRPTASGKGPFDPCPTGFRVPTTPEFQALIEATTLKGYVGTRGVASYAMQLVSKRNSKVLMTIPAQGYINVAGSNSGLNWSPASVVDKGNGVDVKSITHRQGSLNGLTTLLYEVLENIGSTGGAGIYGLNGSGYNSTGNPAVAHSVRCIAIPD